MNAPGTKINFNKSEEKNVFTELDQLIKETELSINELAEDLVQCENIERSFSHSEISGKDDFEINIGKYQSMEKLQCELRNCSVLKDILEKLDTILNIGESRPKKNISLSDFNEQLALLNSIIVEDATKNVSRGIFLEILEVISQQSMKCIEDSLLKIKYPIFDGFLIHTMLVELKEKQPNEMKFFSEYFRLLANVLSNDSHHSSAANELISSFLFKRIDSTILNVKSTFDSDQFTNQTLLFEFLESLLKYITVSIDNTSDIFFACVASDGMQHNTIKERRNCVFKFILQNLFSLINSRLEVNSKLIDGIASTEENLINTVSRFTDFNKHLKKIYMYDVFTETGISDFIGRCVSGDVISEFIKKQKAFTAHTIKNELKEKISCNIDKNKYNFDEVFDMVKMLVKDNYNLFLLLKTPQHCQASFQQNCIFAFREIFNLLRGYYNEEVQFFSTKRNLSNKKSIFILNLLIKFLHRFNAFYSDVDCRTDSMDLEFKESVNKVIHPFLHEMNSLVDNYTKIITKGLGFEDLVSLFSSEELSKLDEEKMNKVFLSSKANIRSFYKDLDQLRVSDQFENFIVSHLVLNIVGKMSAELEKSLPKKIKNQLLHLLVEKAKEFIEILITRETLSERSLNSFNKPVNGLYHLLGFLSMNKI